MQLTPELPQVPPVSTPTVVGVEDKIGKCDPPLDENVPSEQGAKDLFTWRDLDIYREISIPEWYKVREFNEIVKISQRQRRSYSLEAHDVHLLNSVRHHDVFSVLGAHSAGESGLVIRGWIKDAISMEVRFVDGTGVTSGDWTGMEQTASWLWEQEFDLPMTYEELRGQRDLIYEYRVKYLGGDDESHVRCDAYGFGITVPDFDLENFQSGHCWHVDNIMGSHIIEYKGIKGVRFAVWAPTAKFIAVVGDWNQWDGRQHPMRRRHDQGVWELFIPNIGAGEKYQYKIHTAIGSDIQKIDPYAQCFENPPAYSSIVSDCDDPYKPESERFQWTDEAWIEERTDRGLEDGLGNIKRRPISIYEVHLPSWRRGEGNTYLSYRQLAEPLSEHVLNMNFTHVEFLPVTQHPFEGSWGYQVSGNYAVYARLGTADDFKYLVNKLHEAGIGVFLDMVPAHFCSDDWGLARYDGQPTYEYTDPREGENKGWGTFVYNFGRSEVRSYLLGAIYHWLRRYHIDGIRIDAVSAMIYKNYCRPDGEWIANEFGGDANLQAISLLREMNWVVHKIYPGVFTMAEESTSWKGVTDRESGLGFDAKWDLGWMNDTLSYTTVPGHRRAEKHNKLTFRGLYVAHESWVCPLSHDEVVSGKGSLLDKMGFAGTSFAEKKAMLKAILGFQITMPGRPLIFMGCEFGQGREWSEARSIDWHEAEEDSRKRIASWVGDVLKLYKTEDALHKGDDESWNFKWSVADAASDNTIAYIRSFGIWNNDILFVANLSGEKRWRYPVGVPHGGLWTMLANSDDWKYGGSMHGVGNSESIGTTRGGVMGWPYCLWLDIAPHSALILKAPQSHTKGSI